LSEPETDFENLFRKDWVHTDLKPDISVPIPEELLNDILIELLLNAFRAVSEFIYDLRKTHPKKREMLFVSEEVLQEYKAKRGSLPHVSVMTGMQKEGDDPFVVLSVSDNGIGMSAPVRDRARDLGFTTKHNGTGIGLTIVSLIARLCGG
jgi:signal transduction histidine kinase